MVICLVLGLPNAREGVAAAPHFNRDIRPILSENCFACHGPDEKKRKGKLRLDQRDVAVAKEAIVPGHPEKSELVARLDASDPDELMPPPESHKKLTAAQKKLLRQWIAAGASYEGHWAYTPVARPTVPVVAGASAPIRNPIDAFVQDRLSREGVAPAAEADRASLIRRLHLDLHGLPPTPREVDSFVGDRAADAYERRVDQLLASPRFAERQAVFWLDAVRYADTTGFHGDQMLSLWPYRDYVVEAFHENLPFDQFTREQIAGDLIPGGGRRQKVASAFNRLNRMTTEGGAQDKEYLAKYAADRVRTVSMAWMGSTLGCAECHDHKFDPFSQRDFYSMEAFFADIEEKGFYPSGFSRGEWGPRMALPSPEQAAALERFDADLKKLRDEAAAIESSTLAKGQAEWESRMSELDRAKGAGWTNVVPRAATSANGATLTVAAGGEISAGGMNPDNDTYTVIFRPGPGRWTALQLRTDTEEDYAGNRIARGWRSYVLTGVEVEAGSASGRATQVEIVEAIPTARGQSDRYPAWAVIDKDPKTGWAMEHDHSGSHRLVLRFARPVETDGESEITVRLRHDSEKRRATIAKFRLQLTQVEGATSDNDALPPKVLAALRAPAETRSDPQKQILAEHYRQPAPELARFRAEEARLSGERALLNGQVPAVLVTKAVAPRMVRVLARGNWMDESGPIVQPAVPARFSAASPARENLTRLDLADWIVSADNPLTARVFVNRLWKQFFGTGLSKVLEDVGSQGEWPSHPELLDWLAAEFMQPGPVSPKDPGARAPHPWDIKHVVRTIVTSHTYRQDSSGTAARRPAGGGLTLLERDPENRLLARQNPSRLDAEIVRDNALAIAGLLRERVGGPSVFPWQPEGYWAPLNYPKREYSASRGEDLYRRSLYTHWQRTFVHPTMLAFDASTREECQVNRAISTTPLQSLVLLNDPIFVEAARAFAQNILAEGGGELDGRLQWAFRRAVARPPLPEELKVLRDLHAAQLARFTASPRQAGEFLRVGEAPLPERPDPPQLAAMTVVARAILNLHETITRP